MTCSTYVGSATTVGTPGGTSRTNVTPGQRSLLGSDHDGQEPLDQDGFRPDLALVLAEAGHGDDVLDEAMQPLRLDDDVGEDLLAGLRRADDRRRGQAPSSPAKIVVTGVRSSCDRTPMNVSRIACRWRFAVTSRSITIVSFWSPSSPWPLVTG